MAAWFVITGATGNNTERHWLRNVRLEAGADQAPVAHAGADFSANEGQAGVALDGSGSSDPDNDPLTYAWMQVPGGTPVALTGANTASPTFTAPVAAPGGGTLSFDLTVTANGKTSTDTVSVTVAFELSVDDGLEGSAERPATYVSFEKSNTFTGPLRVSGTLRVYDDSGLGTTAAGTTIDGSGSLWIEASSARVIAEPLTLNGEIRTFVDGPGTGGEVTLTGNILTDTGFSPKGKWVLATPLKLSGALSGAGGHSFSGADVRVALSGNSANSFQGLCFTSIDLFLDKPAGITAVPGNLRAEEGATVLWARDNQVGDGAALTLHGATADLNDKTDTISSLIFDFKGGVVRTGFPGGLRLNGTLRSIPTSTTASPRIEGNLLLGAPAVGVTVGGAGPPVGLEIAAAISPAVTGARLDLLAGGGITLLPGTNSWSVADGTAEPDLQVDALVRELILTDALLEKSGAGSVVFTAANTVDAIVIQQGNTTWNSNSPNTKVTAGGGTLQGTGRTAGFSMASGAILAPGNSPGIFTTAGLDLTTGGTLRLELNGAAPGTGHDQIRCTATAAAVDLSGGTLQLSQGFAAAPGQALTVIDVQGTGAAVPFSGLPEGSTALAGIQRYRISYLGEMATTSP